MRMESHFDVGRYFSTNLLMSLSPFRITSATTWYPNTTMQHKAYTIFNMRTVFLLGILQQCIQDWARATWFKKVNQQNYTLLIMIWPIPIWPNLWTYFFTLHLCFTDSFVLQMCINPSPILVQKLCCTTACAKTYLSSSSLTRRRSARWVNARALLPHSKMFR